jgi:ribosomal protein S12 methylthiotransferase accessory factor
MWNLDDNVVTFDTRNLAYTHHPVSQRPQCAACGSLKRPLASPAGVLLERIVSPISGIVTGLTVTSQPVLGHYHARTEVCSPAPQSPDRPIIRPSVSIGKHPSREIARQVALGEAVERYSIVFQGDEPEHVAKEAELPSIPLARLSEFSAAQFANRDSINPSAFDRSHIPIELGPSQIIRWTSGRYLLAKRGDVFLPSCFCYMGHPESSYCQADTNGCAAAPTIDQALVAALYELIERDAAGIWWFNRISRPLVEAASLADPQILTFVADFHKAGRTLHLLDIRADLPLPVFAAVSTLPDGSEIMLGLGCRPSAASAARHAISELSQVCHWLGQRPPGPGLWRRWLDTATLANQPYLAGGPPEKPTLDWPTDGSHQPIVEMLEKYGFTPAMVDLSRPDLPLKVVRAVVPGFAHFWPRLGSRRLYEVPVRLGWLDQSRDESDLNSLPCPL